MRPVAAPSACARTLAALLASLALASPPGALAGVRHFAETSSWSDSSAVFKIAYASDLGDSMGGLYMCNSDGSDPMRLTYGAWEQGLPRFSPDGTRIAYGSLEPAGISHVWLMNVDGSDARPIGSVVGSEPSWSPDGSKFAFYGPNEGLGTFHVAVMDTDGTGFQVLTPTTSTSGGPDWSPDGARITFHSDRDGHLQIYSMNADGTDPQRLTSGPRIDFMPRWSPDGTRIVYGSCPDETFTRAAIRVVNPDGSGDTALTDDITFNSDAAWSPDGARIVFRSNRDGPSEIYTMNPDGSDVRRVTTNGIPGSYGNWSPAWGAVVSDARIHVAAETEGHGVRVHWNPSPWPGVLRYDVYRSATSQARYPTLAGSAADTAFNDVAPFGSWYYRVRAVRDTDQSLYSNEVLVPVCARTASYFPAGSTLLAPVPGDFNEDGITDLAVLNGLTSGTVSILLGQGSGGVGDGTFAPRATYAAGATPSALVTGDFNEDGITDLAVANDDLNGTFTVLLGGGAGGVGDGTFAAGVAYAVGSRPSAIAAGDLDEDGITDLVVANRGSNTVSVVLGQGTGGVGDGTFAAHVPHATASQPGALATGDFNDDGITDLAVVGTATGHVSILLGLGSDGAGDGTFAAAVSYTAGSYANALATGDFDDDGGTDLAVTLNKTSAEVAVLRGLGDGSFASAVRYAAGTSAAAVLPCDFDGDGITDLVVANRSGNAVSCLLGNGDDGAGDGTFSAPLTYAVGTRPSGLAVGDFAEDGRPDLVVSHASGTNALALLPGSCEAVVPTGLTLIAPDGGEEWCVDSEAVISWEKGTGILSVDVEISRDGGTRWERLATGLTGTRLAWTVTEPVTGTAAALVRVSDPAAPARGDTSDASFTVTTRPAEAPIASAHELALEGARPSPARGGLSVAFTLPDRKPATLELMDVAGRRLQVREVGALGPGRHVTSLGAAGSLPPGLYFLRLRAGARSLVARAVVLPG